MDKTNNKYILLALNSCIFSLAVMILPSPMNLQNRIYILSVNAIVNIIFSILIFNNKQPKPLTDMFIIIYLLLIISKHIYSYSMYIKTYHRQIFNLGNIILSALIIIMLCFTGRATCEKLVYPISFFTTLLLILCFALNIKNFSFINLYRNSPAEYIYFFDITLFDYIVPLNILFNTEQKRTQKTSILTVLLISFTVLAIFLLNFGCIEGNMMYSISPLQSIFRITSGSLLKNFDSVFNYLLFFAYFSSLLLPLCAYMKIKERFTFHYKIDLLLVIPFLILGNFLSDRIMFIIQIFAVVLLFIGKEKTVYEKT